MAEFGKGRELLELETVQRAIDESAAWAGAEFARKLREGTRYLIGTTLYGGPVESPIEAAFFAWFGSIDAVENDNGQVYQFGLLPQQEVTIGDARYRFDFTVYFGPDFVASRAAQRGIAPPRVAIELDGHEFHERTKEQVAYRNERDRDAQAAGWTILHFSGSELYRDPLKCARGVMELCRAKHDEWSHRVWARTADAAADDKADGTTRGTT